ncbi:hypothetical protein DH2020_010365 [Rehmannia glutinosa]|uniref:Uncharacterized protein n=1 Tax=Rehmannia glutinosa TaxID=99300 RepID=A0ABR0XAG7_REHGL
MDVQIVSTEIIKPSVPTPHHLKNFKISFLDQTSASFYIPLTLFYNTKFNLENISQIHGNLKKSLSETLKLFYPVAGKVQDMFTIDCNDQGAFYTEAKANFMLSEYLQKPHLNSLNKFLPRHPNILENGPDFQVLIQVTILACGGLVIGACVFHRVVDIATMANFLRTWASFCRGDCREVNFPDLSLGSSIFPQLSSLPGDYMTNYDNHYFSQGKNYSVTRRFVFNASAIAALRAKAKSDAVPNPSRIEALTGRETKRLEPPLPENALETSRGLRRPSTARRAGNGGARLRGGDEEALEGINGESLNELEPERALNSLIENIGTMNGNDEVRGYKFTSWCNMGFYEHLDFGWGLRPVWVAHMGDAAKGMTKHQFMFIEGNNFGEIELWMLFSEEEMAILENDPEFIAFATPNPSISI